MATTQFSDQWWWVYQSDKTLSSSSSRNLDPDLFNVYTELKLALLEKRSETVDALFEKVDDMMRRTPKTSVEHIQDFKYLPLVKKQVHGCLGVIQIMGNFMERLLFSMITEAENEESKNFLNSVLCSLLKNFAYICVLPLNFYSILMLLDYPEALQIFLAQTWPTLLKTKQLYFSRYGEEVGKYFSLDYVDLYSNFQAFDFSRKLNSYGHSFLTLAISVERLTGNKFYVHFFVDQVKSSSSFLSDSHCNGLNAPNHLGWTPLCWALYLHALDTAKLLIECKANVRTISLIENKSMHPMALAIENQQPEIIHLIQEASKSKERIVSQKCVLELATKFAIAQNDAGMRFFESQVLLAFHHTSKKVKVDSISPPSASLEFSSLCCSLKCFAIVDLNVPVDTEGNTLLHRVVEQENLDLFVSFLNWNAALAKCLGNHPWCINPRIQNKKGNTVLHILAKQIRRTLVTLEIHEWWNWVEVLKHLMQQALRHVEEGSADFQNAQKTFVNTKNKRGQTCLHLLAAISLQDTNLIKAELNGSLNSYQVQKMKDYEDLLCYFIEECGASIDLPVDPVLNEKPWTEINFFKECHLASKHPKMQQFGKNALMLAISHANVSFYRYIFEKLMLHFDIFKQDNYGNTVLHLAILAGEHYFNSESNFYFQKPEFSPLLQIHFAIFTHVNSSIEYLVSRIRSTANAQKENYTGLWKNTDLFNTLNHNRKSFLHLAVETITPLRVQDYQVLFDKENGSYFQFQDVKLRTPLMLALSSGKNCNNLPLFMVLSKDIVFDMRDCKGKNIFHMLMESFTEPKHKSDFFQFLMQEPFHRQWARVSCEAMPQYAYCKEEQFHVDYILKTQFSPTEEIDIYKNRALVLNQEDQEMRSPFHKAYLEHDETMTLLLLKHGASWYEPTSSAFFDFVHERSLINQRHFKSFIEDKFIWRQKILVVREAFKYTGSKNCHVSKLCKEILNQIFRLGFQNPQHYELFMQRLKNESGSHENKLLSYKSSQKYKAKSAMESHVI